MKHRVLFYNASIRPVMDYVSVIWSNCDKHCLDRVLKLQKRAARIVIGADSYALELNEIQKVVEHLP